MILTEEGRAAGAKSGALSYAPAESSCGRGAAVVREANSVMSEKNFMVVLLFRGLGGEDRSDVQDPSHQLLVGFASHIYPDPSPGPKRVLESPQAT